MIVAITITINTSVIISATGIHNGENIHNQLQSATGFTSANFKTENIINKRVPNPIVALSLFSGIK